MDATNDFVRGAGRGAVAGGVLGLAALVTVLAIEATSDGDMMGSALTPYAGWASFVASSLLVVGLLGVAVRYAATLSGAGRAALLVLGFATAITVGAMGTLALVVPTLMERAPDLVNDPPAAVPPTFIFSGLVMGVCALVLAVSLRRSGVHGVATKVLFAGAVVAMVPLPSRFFLLCFAVGLLALAPEPARSEPERVGQIS